MLNLKRIFILSCLAFLFTGCMATSADKASPPVKPEISAWLAYWDMESGAEELKKITRDLDSLSYFAAYFDKDGHAFVPPEMEEFWKQQQGKKRSYDVYLTFVNDKLATNGKALMKDTDFLMELWSTDERMAAHVDELINLTKAGGFDGLEIDYERLWHGDKAVAEKFLAFTYRLAVQAQQAKLKLRIVLEPGADFRAPFCKGPEYVVMLYNLHGTHNDAGPKADFNFIADKAAQMAYLPGEPAAALATGGCQWGSDGSKVFISEQEADELAKKYKAAKRRDEASSCVVFTYEKNSVIYEVWYADRQTLKDWIKCAVDGDITKISLWRLGSNINIHKVL